MKLLVALCWNSRVTLHAPTTYWNQPKHLKVGKSYFLTMEITKISSKGQIVIPQKIRNELNIEEGSMLMMDKMKDTIIIRKIDEDLVNQFKRSLEDVKSGRIKRVA